MNEQQQIEALQRRVEELSASHQRRVEELSAQLEQLARSIRPVQGAEPDAAAAISDGEEPRSSRRGLLKLAGAAVAGAAASGLAAAPAAAADGDAITLGQAKTATTNRTRADYTGGLSGGQAFLFQAGNTQDGNEGYVSAALAGWTTVAGMPNGIYGYSNLPAGKGVYGRADGNGAAAGVHGFASGWLGVGVLAENNNDSATALAAMTDGSYATGIYTDTSGSSSIGVISKAIGHLSTGVLAMGDVIGVDATGDTAVRATGNVYGLSARGGRVAVYLEPHGSAPPSGATAHFAGEFTVDSAGALWFCSADGSPGTWQKLGGPGTGGSFHPITPARVHDSRKPTVNPITSTSAPRLVNVANKIDATGAVVTPNIVPTGATAIAYNLTIVNTVGTNGFLAINPGGINTASATAINWSASNLSLANASVVTLNTNRQVTVICGGTSTSTNFTIDVVGYYR